MLEIALPPLTSKLTIYTSALELDAELLELVDDSLLEDTDEELVTSELGVELLELVDDSLLDVMEEEVVISELDVELLELVDDSLLEVMDEKLVISELGVELFELVDDSLLEKAEEELITSELELVVLIEGSSIVDVDILEDCEELLEISSEIDESLIELPLFEQLDKTVSNRIKLRRSFDFMI